MSGGTKKCCAPDCASSSHDVNVSLFRFPKDEQRCSLWKQLLGNPEYVDYSSIQCYNRLRLCSLHFKEECFSSKQKNRLKNNAVPSFTIGPESVTNEEENKPDQVYEPLQQETDKLTESLTDIASHIEIEMSEQPMRSIYSSPVPSTSQTGEVSLDVETQTPLSLSSHSPRKERLKQMLKNVTRKLERKARPVIRADITEEDVGKFLDEHFSEDFSNFVKLQMSLLGKSPKGSRYTNAYKQFALALYFLGPQAYKQLRGIFRLPSKTTLQRISKRWEICSGFNDFIFAALKLQVDLLDDTNRDCIICIDEMSIKTHLFYNISKDEMIGFHEVHKKKHFEPATSALVVMARGINSNWKQPLAYFFVKSSAPVDDLKEIVFETVTRLESIGLNAMAVVSDQGSNFYKLVKSELKVTVEKPYFYVGSKQVCYMFDIPHLLKSTRNNFFSYNFIIDGGITDKCYLEQLYALDKMKQYRLAPKLTNDHVYPSNFQRMKVKYASQVFSYSIAVAMQTYMSFNQLPAAAASTAIFIEKMDKLFDVLNSSRFSQCKEFNKAFTASKTQLDFLNEMDSLFKNLKIQNSAGKDVTKQMKFIYGWRLTISSFLHMWQVLKNKNVNYIFTRNLNQDCLENYFGKIRNTSGNARNPTPIQFSRAFKKLFTLQYFEHSEGGNCLEDFNDVLSVISPEVVEHFQCLLPTYSAYRPLKVETEDYADLTTSEGNALVYVSGYFIKKCLKKHTCEICVSYANSKSMLDAATVYSHFKAYETKHKDTFGKLQMPNDDFINYIVKLENLFVDNFNSFAIQKQVGYKLKQKFSSIEFIHPCPNFPLDYFLSLFTRVRIYYTLKFANRELKSQRINKQPLKLMILKNV